MKYIFNFILLFLSFTLFGQDDQKFNLELETNSADKKVNVVVDGEKSLLLKMGVDFDFKDFTFVKNTLTIAFTTCTTTGRKSLIVNRYRYLEDSKSWLHEYTDYSNLISLSADCQTEMEITSKDIAGHKMDIILRNNTSSKVSYDFESSVKQLIVQDNKALSDPVQLKKTAVLIKDGKVVSN